MHLLYTLSTILAATLTTSMVASAPLNSVGDINPILHSHKEKREVINPHITYPDTTAVWHTGQKGVNATWEVPPNAAGYKGKLLLGYLLKNDTSGSEHLFLDPLADGFNLTDGHVTFDIPCNNEIKSRASYIVVLMGDSGNKSSNFTIHREVDSCPNLKPKHPKSTSILPSGTSTGTAGIPPASSGSAASADGTSSGAAAAAATSAPAPAEGQPASDSSEIMEENA